MTLALASLLCTSATSLPLAAPAARGALPRVEPPPAAQPAPKQPPPGPEPQGPAEAAIAALAFAEKAGPDLAPYLRFFWVSSAAKHRDDFLVAFSIHVNLLSTEGVIRWPVQVAPDVLAVDVRDYGWDKKDKLTVYEKTAALDPYFHQPALVKQDGKQPEYWPGGRDGSKDYARGVYQRSRKAGETVSVPAVWLPQQAIDALRKLTYSESPILMAEWFFVQTARQTSLTNDDRPGIGQLDFLGIKDRDDFFEAVGVDPKVASRVFAEWRAVIQRSGISKQNRIVVTFGGATGRVWGTLDVFAQKDRGIAQDNLRPGELDHDAEEWIARRGNGTWITALIQAKDLNGVKAGTAVASAPDKIGPDQSPLNPSNDHRVHQGLSCIRCHFSDKDGLKPVDDWARKTFRKGGPLRLADPDRRTLLELESLYLRDLDEILDEERARYARDFRRATTSQANPNGLTMTQIGKVYAAAWDRYAEEDLAAADQARELGAAAKTWTGALEKWVAPQNRGAGDLVLAPVLDGQKIQRLNWENRYALAQTLTLGLNPPVIPKEVPKKDDFAPLKKEGKK